MDWKGFEPLKLYVEERISEFDLISAERQERLRELASLISTGEHRPINIIFICTHNSRRSQMAQLWAALGAVYYSIDWLACYSGGTEVTAFSPLAVASMKEAGFSIKTKIPGANPFYLVSYPGRIEGIKVFSKKYTDPPNPIRGFHAIMTCSDADHACPIVIGAATRHSITYEDPKVFEGTPNAKQAYADRCAQIAREMLYLTSLTS